MLPQANYIILCLSHIPIQHVYLKCLASFTKLSLAIRVGDPNLFPNQNILFIYDNDRKRDVVKKKGL